MKRILVSAFCALALIVPHLAARAADTFWVPFHDGQTLSFLESGSMLDSDGASSTWGPVRVDIRVQAVNVQILTHQANWRLVGGDDRFTGTYLAQTAAGLFRVSEGNPVSDPVYRYYTDPEPWLYLTQPLEVGQPVTFAGLRRGQWAVPGGGTEAWSGTWSVTLTHLGTESVTTPLGTFVALKLRAQSVTTVDTRALFPNYTERGTWDELRWFVPGLGYVKIEGSGRYEHDFNGDSVVDRWQDETLTMLAVPVPPPTLGITAAIKVSEGAASAKLTVSRTGDSAGAVSVDFTTADASALATSDYAASAGTLSWANGEMTAKTITIPILHDADNEPPETFTVSLSNPTGGAILGNASAAVTITDDDPISPFADTAGHWALGYINAIYGAGITLGCSSGSYCPANNVTRDQMAAFIIRAVEGEPPACTNAPFLDVPIGSAFCKYIKRMKDLNITAGCSLTNYCPSQIVTREQMAAFIIRALEGNPAAGYCGSSSPFADVPTTSVFCGHIKRLQERRITLGCGNGIYCPTALVTRDQMAAFLARAFLGMD